MVLGSQCFPEEAVGESVTRFVGCFGEPVEQRTGIARQPKRNAARTPTCRRAVALSILVRLKPEEHEVGSSDEIFL